MEKGVSGLEVPIASVIRNLCSNTLQFIVCCQIVR